MLRIAYVVGALGASLAMTGCYSVPQPACGFFCGSGGACPADYTCSAADNRCHLNGSPAQMCSTLDAGTSDAVDAPLDASAPPTIVSSSPGVGGETGVTVAPTVTVTFSEEVFGVNGATFSLRTGATPVPAVVVYATGTHVATLTPSEQLLAGTTYVITLTSGITDSDGLSFGGLLWTFTTGSDTVGPNLQLRSPAPNDTFVPVTESVLARFDEPVIGVSATTFTLKNGATPITGTTTYTTATRTAQFTPDAQLPGNTVLTATLTSGITDVATNPLAGAPVSWTFTTEADGVAPMFVSSTPANGSTAIATGTTITVVFDEPLSNVNLTTFTVNDGAAVAGTLASSLGGRAWTFTPTAALAAAATITVTLSTAITDATGNALPAPVTLAFTTQ